MPVPGDADALWQIADETGGRFATAATEKDLHQTYQNLGSRLAEARKSEVTVGFVGTALLFAFALPLVRSSSQADCPDVAAHGERWRQRSRLWLVGAACHAVSRH